MHDGDPPRPPMTLSVDIGGSHIKASVLDAGANMVADRVRIATPYPVTPAELVEVIAGIARQLPPFDQVSVALPGMIRQGIVLSTPHFVTAGGPGSEPRPDLVRAWDHTDLATAIAKALGKPTMAVNDADQQGAAVVRGKGLELVLTLGTGLGTAFFQDGVLLPHLEIAHHPFRKGQTYDEQLGDLARRAVGNKRWTKRVQRAVANLAALSAYDHLYIGGGNTKHLTEDFGPGATIVDNTSGIIGGARLWDVGAHAEPSGATPNAT